MDSMDSVGSCKGAAVDEAEVTGKRGRRALFTIGNETVADIEIVEETAADVLTVEVTGRTGTEVTGADVTGTVTEVDFFNRQLRDRCPVCSHRKHCGICPR